MRSENLKYGAASEVRFRHSRYPNLDALYTKLNKKFESSTHTTTSTTSTTSVAPTTHHALDSDVYDEDNYVDDEFPEYEDEEEQVGTVDEDDPWVSGII